MNVESALRIGRVSGTPCRVHQDFGGHCDLPPSFVTLVFDYFRRVVGEI